MKVKQAIGALHAYCLTKYAYALSKKSSDHFYRWQNKKLIRHIKKVEQQSPYYHQFKEIQWSQKPIINKQLMLEHFDKINTKQFSLNEVKRVALQAEKSRDFSSKIDGISVGLSSGTSGNHGVFLVSDDESARWAGSIIAKLISFKKYKKEKIKIAFFMRANNNLYETINSKKFELHFFDLQHSFDIHFPRLEQLNPNVLIAQPSVLRILIEHYKEAMPFQFKDVFSVAEVLDPLDQKIIEKALNVPIRQIYQATEGLLGYTCEHGGLHLNEDILYIEKEYIDENRFVPVITDMYRLTQPYIRYRLNDVLVESKKKCACGSCFTKIDMIEGREDDCFIFENVKGEEVRLFPDFIRYAIIHASDSITGYKALQNKSEVRIFLDGQFENWNQLCSTIESNIDAYFEKNGISKQTYILIFVKGVPLSEHKKMRRIERIIH